ncbi:hypothetical protein T439DRAFT_208625 [Meredithblackwellia eburnea MCA 4105]
MEPPLIESAAPNSNTKASEIRSTLSALDRARQSLPSLLRSFAIPTASSNERATIYRDRSNEAWNSIKALSDQLKSIQNILDSCDQSERDDAVGIVDKPRENRSAVSWARLGDILGNTGAGSNGSASSGKRKVGGIDWDQRAFSPQLKTPLNPGDLDEIVKQWTAERPRVTIELNPSDSGKEQRELKLVLKGTMKAVCMLHWSEVGSTGVRSVQVERVACFSLKEDKSSYLQSQFSLFQSITNKAMEVIGASLIRTESAQTPISNVEEVLNLLSNPPLPF